MRKVGFRGIQSRVAVRADFRGEVTHHRMSGKWRELKVA
jgi:hypothetical protein